MKNAFNFIPFLIAALSFSNGMLLKKSFTGTEDILTQSIWTDMESWKDKDGDGVFTFDTDSCQADNNWLFRPNGTFESTEDVRKCEPDMPFLDTVSGNWLLQNNQTILKLTFPDGSDEIVFQIFAVGEHELILHITDPDNVTVPAWEKVILRR